MIIWMIIEKIIRTVLCCIMSHNFVCRAHYTHAFIWPFFTCELVCPFRSVLMLDFFMRLSMISVWRHSVLGCPWLLWWLYTRSLLTQYFTNHSYEIHQIYTWVQLGTEVNRLHFKITLSTVKVIARKCTFLPEAYRLTVCHRPPSHFSRFFK